jgi:lysophospholipase L1-like esterase
MAVRHFNTAEYPSRGPVYLLPSASTLGKALSSLMILSLLILSLGGCSVLTGGHASSSSPDEGHQQAQGQLTYVAIGASDTFGIGTTDPYNQNWASDLAREIGPRYHLINLGIPGAIMSTATSRELPIALDTHPNLVTIWLGVNDIADNVPLTSYARDLDVMLSRLQAEAPGVRIAIANIPDLTLLPHFSSFDPQVLHMRISSYNAAIVDSVQQHHIILVDLAAYNTEIKNHPEYLSNDGFHPNELGYSKLAELFYQVLQRAHALA